jgi:hypothetical protein
MFLASCERDLPIPEQDECYSFGTSSSPLGFQYEYADYLFREPAYNPLNSDEFIYVREDKLNNSSTELRKHIISTGFDQVLTTNVWGVPDWHQNGWIIFRRTDNQVWKIKSDGDSLIQLTFSGTHLGPRWNTSGDKFVCSWDNQTLIAASNGIPVDTIPEFLFYYGDWSSDETKLCSVISSMSGEYLAYYDINSSTQTLVAEVPQGEFIIEAYWLDSRFIYWVTRRGVYKTDIVGNVTSRVTPSCDSKFWWSFQFSGDGQNIIWERANFRLTGANANTIYQENHIYVTNLDCTNEQKIDLE